MANVLIYDPNDSVSNRVVNYLLSVNTPDYEGLPNTLVNPDLSGVEYLDKKYWKVSSGSVVAMSDSEKNIVDLPEVKTIKITEIQNKTDNAEIEGVPYNNYRFSITPSAKTNWLAIVMVKDTLIYPFNAPTGFDAIYPFANANDVLGFFAASMSYLTYWESSNEQLIIAVKACATVEQVDAIVDDRVYPPN